MARTGCADEPMKTYTDNPFYFYFGTILWLFIVYQMIQIIRYQLSIVFIPEIIHRHYNDSN